MSIWSKRAVPVITAIIFAVIFMSTRDSSSPQTMASNGRSGAVATGETLTPLRIESLTGEHEESWTPTQQISETFEPVASPPHQLVDANAFDAPPPQIPGREPTPTPAQGLTDPAQLAALGLDAEEVSQFQLGVDRILQERAGLTSKLTQEGTGSNYEKARLAELQYELKRIRENVGDDGYDRRLYATGKPNRVVISASSADATFAVGLALGDIIVSYNGWRVFDAFEVQAIDKGGDPEEMVHINVMRGDELIEIAAPRGVLQDIETATHSVSPIL